GVANIDSETTRRKAGGSAADIALDGSVRARTETPNAMIATAAAAAAAAIHTRRPDRGAACRAAGAAHSAPTTALQSVPVAARPPRAVDAATARTPPGCGDTIRWHRRRRPAAARRPPDARPPADRSGDASAATIPRAADRGRH